MDSIHSGNNDDDYDDKDDVDDADDDDDDDDDDDNDDDDDQHQNSINAAAPDICSPLGVLVRGGQVASCPLIIIRIILLLIFIIGYTVPRMPPIHRGSA